MPGLGIHFVSWRERTSVSRVTIILGLILIVVGLVGYFGSGMISPTALIPAAIGAVFVALGCVAGRGSEHVRKHTMHAALVLALITVVMTFRGLLGLPTLLSGVPVPNGAAILSKSITALLCLLFIGLGINSFIQARKNRAKLES